MNAKAIANKVPFNKVTVHKLGMLANLGELGELGALGGKIGQLTWQNV
ncbi:hypothetical protein AB6N28_02165 [Moraxella osloensis]